MVQQLHPDLNFHYETMRALGTIPYHGADLMEVLEIMPKIAVNDFDSWYNEWFALAQRVLATIDETKLDTYNPVTLRNVYFRVSHYIFVADFFLHNKKSSEDPRIPECYKLLTEYFNKANALLPIPGIHAKILADGFWMPAIIYRTAEASASNPRPTVIIGGGFESVMQETYHVNGADALARGYNVILYEGPGHRTLIETQGKGFIPDWEKAVTPIIDYIMERKDDEFSFMDTSKLGLVGMSMGGYLASRAAAHEPRLAAVVAFDGVWSMLDCMWSLFPEGKQPWEERDVARFNDLFENSLGTGNSGQRWLHDDLKFTFNKNTGYEVFEVLQNMTMGNGVAQKIKMPAFVGDAADDMFFEGQPAHLAEEIGGNAMLFRFTNELGAQLHCQSGAFLYMNQVIYEWFAGIVGS